jgi:aspartate aminotransferase/aminotransferase
MRISDRAKSVDASGIRRVFDLAAKLKDPVNLSIGQPDFDAPLELKGRLKAAVDDAKNGYTVTQGISEVRRKIREKYAGQISPEDEDWDVFITAGVSGGLLLSFLAILDPGDEILVPDPYFCIYRDLALMLNAVPRYYDTYPDFALCAEKIEAAITAKTRAIVVNSPSNPTGIVCSQAVLEQVVEVARRHKLYLIYDEIYDIFCYDEPHAQCLGSYEQVILLNGMSKSAGVPGWRLGYVFAPKELVGQMLKLQQYTIVCAHSAAQWSMLDALDLRFEETVRRYREKRDFIVSALRESFEFVSPGGAFYLFPRAPGGSGQRFVEKCIDNNLLVIPGQVFSRQDTHFRISFSAPLETLERGAEILNSLV